MNRIRNFIKYTLLLYLTVFYSCANLPVYEAKLKSETSTVDPMASFFDSKNKISYDVCQNDSMVYIHLSTVDYMTQVKIAKLGITLWLDQKGKKTQEKSIKFPLKKTEVRIERNQSRGQKVEITNANDGKSKQLLEYHKMNAKSGMILSGFKKNNGMIEGTALESCPIKTTITIDAANRLHYNVEVPIEYIFTNKKYSNNIFSIGIISGSIAMSDLKQEQVRGNGQKGGGMSGGAGRGSGGRSGGGGRPGGSGNRSFTSAESPLSTPIKFWFQVELNQ